MSAPNTPVGTGRPSSCASAATKASNRGRAISGGAAPDHDGRLPLRVEAYSVNWLTARIAPPDVDDRAVHHARVVVEDAQRDDLAREPVAVVVGVVGRHAGQHQQPRPDRGDALAVDADRGLAHPLDQRAHRRPGASVA